MNSEWAIWFFEAVVLFAALAILFTKSVFHASMYLLITVLSIGVLFALYGSEFFFIAQILVYGGGILVLILFATMVTSRTSREVESVPVSIPLFLMTIAVMILITVWVMAYQPTGIPYVITTDNLGKQLILEYSLPLEIAGILLLVSLIGSAITAIQKPDKQ